MSITVMKLALDALEYEAKRGGDGAYLLEREALRQAITEAEKQAVAWMGVDSEGNPNKFRLNPFGGGVPLYTTPPAAQRQPHYNKTEMNCFVQNLYDQKMREGKRGHYETMFHVVHRAIEAAHGIGEKK